MKSLKYLVLVFLCIVTTFLVVSVNAYNPSWATPETHDDFTATLDTTYYYQFDYTISTDWNYIYFDLNGYIGVDEDIDEWKVILSHTSDTSRDDIAVSSVKTVVATIGGNIFAVERSVMDWSYNTVEIYLYSTTSSLAAENDLDDYLYLNISDEFYLGYIASLTDTDLYQLGYNNGLSDGIVDGMIDVFTYGSSVYGYIVADSFDYKDGKGDFFTDINSDTYDDDSFIAGKDYYEDLLDDNEITDTNSDDYDDRSFTAGRDSYDDLLDDNAILDVNSDDYDDRSFNAGKDYIESILDDNSIIDSNSDTFDDRSYLAGQQDIIDNGTNTAQLIQFVPGVLGVMFGFFMQIANISVMGISILDILSAFLGIIVVLMLFKVFMKR